MKATFSTASADLAKVVDHFAIELNKIRAGRVTLDMFEHINVEAYGQKMPLNQVANINIVDATLVTLKPWDKGNVSAVNKAIQSSDLGINPSIDGDMVRLPIPALTQDKREQYVKMMKTKQEESKIAVRNVRQEIMDDLKTQKSNSVLTEDDFVAKEKQLQKQVDETNQKIDQMAAEKEKNLMQV